ncbi:MAG TPA: hypothetical protein VN694_11970 [Caulobacteraceae bacterium]|nr:hypothetical protein [Caulobacteraceae bacterium]
MRTFRIFLHQRGLPPVLHLVTAFDDAMAKAIAADLMEGSLAHVGVEVWFGERRLFVRGSVPDRRFEGQHRCTGARHGAPKLLN